MADPDDLTVALGVLETRLRLVLSALVDLRAALAARGTTPRDVLLTDEAPGRAVTVH